MPELPRQQAGCERDARDHADVALRGLPEEQLGGSLPEHVEDDLDRRDARVLDRLQRLLHLLDADPVRAHEALVDETVAGVEHRRRVVRLPGEAVELHEIDGLDAEVVTRTLDPAAEVVVGVEGEIEWYTAPELRRHDERLRPLAQELPDKALGAAVAVHVGGVDEGHARVDGGVEGRQRLAVVDGAPIGADAPGSEADLGDLVSRLPKPSRVHQGSLRFYAPCRIFPLSSEATILRSVPKQ